MNKTVAAIGLAHPFEVGYDNADYLLNETSKAMKQSGLKVINTNIILHSLETVERAIEVLKKQTFDVLVVCIATWSEDHHLLDLCSVIHEPIILRAFPHRETGSLCCAHQIGAVFTDIGKGYDFIYGAPDNKEAIDKINKIATSYALVKKMKTVRVGTIGGRVKGMTEIAYDEFSIKKKIGARVVNIDESELTDRVSSITDRDAHRVLYEIDLEGKGCLISTEAHELLESIKYYIAMKQLTQVYGLEALSVKCYTKYMGKVCLGYALLAEEGIVSSCEGDVTSALTMKLLYELSEAPINNTDLLYIDHTENTILFSHCGSSGFSIAAERVNIAPVRLANCGACALFTVKTGSVTAVNIVGSGENLRLAIMVGESIPCAMEFPGNPVKIKFEKDVNQINEEIVKYGVGHHWMVGYGDYREELRNFCKINGIKMYEI